MVSQIVCFSPQIGAGYSTFNSVLDSSSSAYNKTINNRKNNSEIISEYSTHESIVSFMDYLGNNSNALNLTTNTAYDIIDLYKTYQVGSVLERRKTMRTSANKYVQVDNFYKLFIRVFSFLSMVLIAISFCPFLVFPKEISITASIAFLIGILGMRIDRNRWRKNYKCF